MKSRTVLVVLAVCIVAGSAFVILNRGEGDHGTDQVSAGENEYYTCPMHPSVRSDRPGACPVCGMALVRKSAVAIGGPETENLRHVSLSPSQRVIANVSTRTVKRGTLQKAIVAAGLVSAAENLQSTVAARFRGRIERVWANVTGEKVNAGEPLFELYSPDLVTAQREYLLTLSGTTSGGTMAEMQERLAEASRRRLHVHFGLTNEQVRELERTRDAASTIVYHSPISGTVIQKRVTPGQYVDEGMVLYELTDLSTVWVYLDIYEEDLRFIGAGQTVVISSSVYPGEEFHGTVGFVDPVVNPETRTVRIRTEMKNLRGKLKPNMYVQGRIDIPVRNALLVPSQAVLVTGKKTVVWVEISSNTFEPRAVTVGATADSVVQVLSGLAEGEVIAATGGYLLDAESIMQVPVDNTGNHDHSAATGSAQKQTPVISAGDVHIRVKGGYHPETIHLRRGVPVRLHIVREEESACTEEIVIADLGIRKRLAAHATTVVEVIPQQAGEIRFSCGMNMVHGTLIVHDGM